MQLTTRFARSLSKSSQKRCQVELLMKRKTRQYLKRKSSTNWKTYWTGTTAGSVSPKSAVSHHLHRLSCWEAKSESSRSSSTSKVQRTCRGFTVCSQVMAFSRQHRDYHPVFRHCSRLTNLFCIMAADRRASTNVINTIDALSSGYYLQFVTTVQWRMIFLLSNRRKN